MRARAAIARQISTTCCAASGSVPTSRFGFRSGCEKLARTSSARCSASVRRKMPQRDGSRPSRMFSATVRCGQSESSWWIRATPRWLASCGEAGWYGSPCSTIVPSSGCSAPARMFMRVLLPAPFSPMSAWTSPAFSEKPTPSSATVGPKRLRMPARWRRSIGSWGHRSIGPWEVHGFTGHGFTPMDPWTDGPMDLRTVRHHRVRQHAQPFDLDFNDVAGLEEDGRLAREADTGRRTGRNDVTGLESDCLRKERHQGVDAEDELIRVRVLQGLPVHAAADSQCVGIAGRLARQDEGAHWRERVARLAALPLAIGKLQVARTDVVQVHVAEHVIERAFHRHVLGAPADDD